jgi:hypothetical protein
MAKSILASSLIGAILVFSTLGLAQYAAAANPLALGEVIVSVGGQNYEVYDQDGNLLDTIDCSGMSTGSFNTGTLVDLTNGFFYGTEFSDSDVCRTDLNGDGAASFGSGYSFPESITQKSNDNLIVGNLGNGLKEFDQTGASVNNFTGAGRVDWHDLAADQCTVLYTDEGSTIHSYDVCTDTANPNFTTRAGNSFFAIRILPNGEVLAAGGAEVVRFDSSGAVLDTYDDAAAFSWFALNLDPDGTSFWSASGGFSDIYKFDIASGTILEQWTPNTNGNVFGLSVVGEITVARNDPCNGLDDNGNQIVDEGVVGVDDDGDGTTDEAGEACREQVVGGEILGVEMTSLFVAGALSNAFWIAPAAAAIGGSIALVIIRTYKRKAD